MDTFDDLLDDISTPNIEIQPHPNADNINQPHVQQPPRNIINRAWVDIDKNNIIQQRTRGGGV